MASVISSAGPGRWNLRLDGQDLVVQTPLPLTPGQSLRLKLVSQSANRWEFQIAPSPERSSPPPLQAPPALLGAFLAHGLPLASERLATWTRWLKDPGPQEKASWAASLEARGQDPASALAQAVEPWMVWLQALEEGRGQPPPEQDPWDEWNLRAAAGGDPWLVVPLHWEYHSERDSGLLQAHWNPQRQAIDRWAVTAAPASTPFRLEAEVLPQSLALVWKFFREEHQRRWSSWLETVGQTGLQHPDLEVSLRVASAEPAPSSKGWRGIDVIA